MEINIASLQKLWKYLPKDFGKQVAEEFNCSASMARYVRDLKDPDMTKMRVQTRKIMLFMAELAKQNKDEVDKINSLAS